MYDAPHSKETAQLFGHDEERAKFIQGYNSGKMHHAWILAGDEGLGKATFAYKAASYLLSGVKNFDAPTHKQILASSHPNLLIIERPQEKTATGLSKAIPIETVRKIHPFFGSTAGESGYRICIIDAVDDLNTNGANALLKMLEEPPRDALFMLISHAPYKLLPTIRSRTRVLNFKPLDEVALKATLEGLGFSATQEVLHKAQGNVRSALDLLDDDVQNVRKILYQVLDKNALNEQVVRLAELCAGKDQRLFSVFLNEILQILHEKALSAAEHKKFWQAKVFDDLSQRIKLEADKTQGLNLDRKAFVVTVMGWMVK
jgi:DNA polymerase III subunit delta'